MSAAALFRLYKGAIKGLLRGYEGDVKVLLLRYTSYVGGGAEEAGRVV